MNLEEKMVRHLAAIQCTEEDLVYPPGLFPSQRMHAYLPYRREDDNIYLTATIILILQDIRADLPDSCQPLVDTIMEKARRSYAYFQNTQGEKTYSFWQTARGKHYPNGLLLSKMHSLRVPDDADSTCIAYITKPHDPADVKQLKDKLAYHSNVQRGRTVARGLEKYQPLKAYSTWFGPDDVVVEFDLGVLCTVLYFVFKNDLPLNDHDRDAITFVKSVLLSRDYIRHKYNVALWYPTVVNLYLAARLIATFPRPEWADCTPELVRDLREQVAKRRSLMDQVILATSLLRLGEDAGIELSVEAVDIAKASKKLSFGAIPMLYLFENALSIKVMDREPFLIKYVSPALCLALLLEYRIYTRRYRERVKKTTDTPKKKEG